MWSEFSCLKKQHNTESRVACVAGGGLCCVRQSFEVKQSKPRDSKLLLPIQDSKLLFMALLLVNRALLPKFT